MKIVYADACYWIALFNPKDQLHRNAKEISSKLGACRIVTSEMIIVELLYGLSGCGPVLREKAVKIIMKLRENPNVEIVPQTSRQLQCAIKRYERMKDKEWGIPDCASFDIMEEKGIKEALTYDRHFIQAGYVAFMKETP
ncbi:MAG: PIN domain-containing protein [Candidatus Omnitrophota bacterium]